MKLYYHPASTTSRPITLFAGDAGIELEYQLVDLFVGEHAQPAFAALNPNMAVPLLVDGDFRLTESSAILKYLADTADSPAYPDESFQRQTLEWSRTRAQRWLGVLDHSWLGSNRYVCGNEISIADYMGIAHVTLGEATHVDYSRWPNVQRWIERMKDRASWATANAAFYRYLVSPLARASFERL